MKHKSMKQIREEVREVNEDFKKEIKEVNARAKEQREKSKVDLSKTKQKYQKQWDDMNEKTVKTYNLFMRSVGVLCLLVGLLCIWVDPLAIILLIGGAFFVRFDANKRKSEYKEIARQEKEDKKNKNDMNK